MTQQEIETTLEEMVDQIGLAFVLDALAGICAEKAEHLRANWQDKTTAKGWDADAKAIIKASRSLSG